jgi:uncharacterized protein YbbC (DUF1343 family)
VVRTGLERALGWLSGGDVPANRRETARVLRTGRLGLVTNPSAVTSDLTPAPEALRAAGCRLAALFGPEHGVRGEIADGAPVAHGTDARSGLPLWSLYGAGYKPTPEMLKGLDGLLFDVQDIGARFYTYGSTLSKVMEAAAEAKMPVVILDRPNPLDGRTIEGPLLEKEHASFVGLHPIPIRHAATLGELGRLWASFGAGVEPWIVPCERWSRGHRWEASELPWVPPSPNMPTPKTALVYPGMCLIEGTNVSEGRGTAGPFLQFGAPWIDAEQLTDYLNAAGLPGLRFAATRFRPTASKHSGETCAGCRLHVRDAFDFRPVAAGVAVLSAIKTLYPKHFAWREAGGRWPVDRLAGTSSLRQSVDAGRPWREIAATWRADEEAHRARLRKVAVYE